MGHGGIWVSEAASPLSVRDQDIPRTSPGVMRSISAWPVASPSRCRSACSSLSGKLNTKACLSPKAEHSSADRPASRVPPGSPISMRTMPASRAESSSRATRNRLMPSRSAMSTLETPSR